MVQGKQLLLDIATVQDGQAQLLTDGLAHDMEATQIKAARERRRQSRISEDGGDDAASVLRATELPSNHPFATSEAVDGDLSAKQAAKIREMNKPRARGRGAAGRKDR